MQFESTGDIGTIICANCTIPRLNHWRFQPGVQTSRYLSSVVVRAVRYPVYSWPRGTKERVELWAVDDSELIRLLFDLHAQLNAAELPREFWRKKMKKKGPLLICMQSSPMERKNRILFLFAISMKYTQLQRKFETILFKNSLMKQIMYSTVGTAYFQIIPYLNFK